METPNTKLASKSVKTTGSQSAVLWSSNSRGPRDEVKGRFTEKSKGSPKAYLKESTRMQEFKLHTEERAIKRAMFDYSVATKLYLIELQKKQAERVMKIIEEEEVRMLRKEMIPRAQLMPLFDRPFFPQRSNRPLTIPREPNFRMQGNKSWNTTTCGEPYNFPRRQAVKPIK